MTRKNTRKQAAEPTAPEQTTAPEQNGTAPAPSAPAPAQATDTTDKPKAKRTEVTGPYTTEADAKAAKPAEGKAALVRLFSPERDGATPEPAYFWASGPNQVLSKIAYDLGFRAEKVNGSADKVGDVFLGEWKDEPVICKLTEQGYRAQGQTFPTLDAAVAHITGGEHKDNGAGILVRQRKAGKGGSGANHGGGGPGTPTATPADGLLGGQEYKSQSDALRAALDAGAGTAEELSKATGCPRGRCAKHLQHWHEKGRLLKGADGRYSKSPSWTGK